MINCILGVLSMLLFVTASAFADAPDGQPTGKRQHEPVTITKPVDKASPAMSDAVDSNEDSDSDDMYDADASSKKSADNHDDSDDAMDIKAVHQPGGSATGATRRRGAADNENVEEKTDKSEAARARKKQ